MAFIDHVDARVRSIAEVRALYVTLLAALGATETATGSAYGETWMTFDFPNAGVETPFFSLVEDRSHASNNTRIAFSAASHAIVDSIADAVRAAGAKRIEGPQIWSEYGPNYYAVFFEDVEGNRLEVCCRR